MGPSTFGGETMRFTKEVHLALAFVWLRVQRAG